MSDDDSKRLVFVDGYDALACVLILPHPEDPQRIVVDASASGMTKAQAAIVLRHIAGQWDHA